MGLVEQLLTEDNGITFKLDMTDTEWYRFYMDHRQTIIDSAQRTLVSAESMFKYQYDINIFLESEGLSFKYAWIFRDLNNITDEQFSIDICPIEFKIPDPQVVNGLYELYKSTRG